MNSNYFYLSLLLIFSLVSKQVKASNQQIIQISPEEMENLRKDPNVKTQVIPLEEDEEAHTKVKEHKNVSIPNFVSGEIALVAFAVVGAVVIIAWIVSFPYALYKAIKNNKSLPRHIFGLNYHSLNLKEAHNSNKSYSSRTGGLTGLKYSFYLGDYVGITSEIGHFSFNDKSFQGKYQNKAQGSYWTIGPSMSYILKMPLNRVLFKIDLGAGSSFNSQIGILSKVEITANILVDSNFFFGLGIGGTYLKVNKFDGVSKTTQDAGVGVVLNSGYVF